jgi:alpha-galactosidase
MSNSWRMSGDVYDSFSRPDARCPCTGDEGYDCALPGFHCSVLNILNKMASIQSKTQSGAVSDMDMLEVGNGGMTDDEYKLHFSMWALNSSPLIIGTDIRSLSASSLSIYSNPAVLALNQDPSVQAAQRHWRFYVNDTDEYGMGEISLWTRVLNNSDVVVALVNAGNHSREMNATLAEVWFDSGAERSSAARASYDVYDLWANRMDSTTAAMVLNGTAPPIDSANSTMRYNATAISYADGLKTNSMALMGQKIGTVPGLGVLTATVPRHGVGLYRLRARPSTATKRDEL